MKRRILEIRRRIDRLDDELLELLIQRLKLGREIGYAKREIGMAVIDEAREQQLLQRLIQKAGSKMSETDVVEIFSKILEMSRRAQSVEPK